MRPTFTGISCTWRQLRNQVYALNQSNVQVPVPITPVPRMPSSTIQVDPTNKQMFDRLATLAIELKEQLNDVEARLVKLEKAQTSVGESMTN